MGKTGQDLILAARDRIREITVQEVAESGRTATLILDVREREETEQGVIPGAKWIPRGFLELKVEQLEPNRQRPVIVYCAGGVRSVLATETLVRMGYENAASLTGGFKAWAMAGKPVERR